MIKDFVEIFLTHKDELNCNRQHPACYKDLVTDLVKLLNKYLPEPEEFFSSAYHPHPDSVLEINPDKERYYEGILIYLIGTKDRDYPYRYWYTTVNYGSCAGCDTLLSIKGDFPEDCKRLTPEQVKDYLTLTLHLVQRMRELVVPSESYED